MSTTEPALWPYEECVAEHARSLQEDAAGMRMRPRRCPAHDRAARSLRRLAGRVDRRHLHGAPLH